MERKNSGEEQRSYLRRKYLEKGIASMTEREILELFLFYAVKKEDVTDVAERMLSRFGSFERIFFADIEELSRVDGLSRNSAALFHLVCDTASAERQSRNRDVKKIDSTSDALSYAENMLSRLVYERLIVITLNEKNEIINCNEIAEGTVNATDIELVKIIKCVINDSASSIILAHNHPMGSALPSNADIMLTKALYNSLINAGVELKDHIIVGKNETLSMRSDGSCAVCFTETGEG